ncbi:MAG: T9SS type A sorting domain-containing protein, partial [bacterium]
LVVSSENPQALILFGLNDTTAYAPNPEGYSIRANVLLLDLPILTNNPNEVRAVFMHTVTDAPAVDFVTANGDMLASNLNYGATSQPISLAAGTYTVDLLRSSDKQKLGTHTLDITNRANGYVVITLSGFLNPAANQNGPAAALGVYEIELTPTTEVEEQNEMAPVSFELMQNYPNPFNPATSIEFSIASDQFVSLKVYDVLGNEVATLVNEKKPAGFYRVSFDAKGLASGVYFYRLQAGNFAATRKLLLVR